MSTKTAQQTVNAFLNKKEFHCGNTYSTGSELFLFGKKIAEYRKEEIYITNAGYPTRTTHDRLNEFPNVHIDIKNGQSYLNNELWDGSWIKIK